jgi:hypothetical protein
MNRILVSAILFIVLAMMVVYLITIYPQIEGFQTKMDTLPIPTNGIVPTGYYQIDVNTMAELPTNDIVSPIPDTTKGYIIPDGYYTVNIDNLRWIAKVPPGFIATPGRDNIIPITTGQTGSNIVPGVNSPGYAGSGSDVENNPIAAWANLNYDSNNYDIQYHDDIDDLIAQGGIYDLSFGTIIVVDAAGKKISIPYVPGRALPIYNLPGSFVHGPSTYVPNYSDSIYLSRSTGISTVSTAVPVSSKLGGFCEHSKTNKTEIEINCSRLPTDVCAATKCCVLLGGTKCVAGDENGPVMKSNYTDPFIRNKDLYYYQGKCYGNCS